MTGNKSKYIPKNTRLWHKPTPHSISTTVDTDALNYLAERGYREHMTTSALVRCIIEQAKETDSIMAEITGREK